MHNGLAAALESTLTLNLRSDTDRNLYYIVEIENSLDGKTTNFYNGENYREACYIADRIFAWLKSNQAKFNLLVEAEHGTGILYTTSDDLNTFPGVIDGELDLLLSEIATEFETFKLQHIHDLNGWFRALVSKHKLNEYQEHKLLAKLKELEYV